MNGFSFFTAGSIRKAGVGHTSTMNLEEFIQGVKEGKWATQAEVVRKQTNKQDKTAEKVKLPYVTLSGAFSESRLKEKVDWFTNYVTLDLDSSETIERVNDDFIKAQFRSVSGKGLCLVIETTAVTTVPEYKRAFQAVSDYFESTHGVEVDKACKDVTRPRFVSFDPEATFVEKPDVFEWQQEVVEWHHENVRDFITSRIHSGLTERHIEEDLLKLDHRLFASSNTYGGTKEQTYKALLDLNKRLNESYGDQRGQNNRGVKLRGSINDILDYTGLYSRVDKKLPYIVRNMVRQFSEDHDMDVALASCLTLFSQLMSKTYFTFGELGKVNVNLFTYVLGDAGAGKSGMTRVAKMFKKVDEDFIAQRNALIEEVKMFNELSKEEQKEYVESGNDRPEVRWKGFIIPADVTAAALKGLLNDTGGLGCLVATEVDTMTRFSGSENDISSLLRESYENETISSARAGDGVEGKRPIYIARPRPSVLISSTFGQVKRLITNVEDGLFSRFNFETLPNNTDLKDFFTTEKVDYTALQDQVFEIYQKSGYDQFPSGDGLFDEMREMAFEFKVNDIAIRKFVLDRLQGVMTDLTDNVSMSFTSSVKRALTRVYRIATVLSALKILEKDGQYLNHSNFMDVESIEAATEIVVTSLEKSVSLARIFEGELAKTAVEEQKSQRSSLDAKVAICEEISGDPTIVNKNKEAVKRLNEMGYTTMDNTFSKWKSRYQKKNNIKFW